MRAYKKDIVVPPKQVVNCEIYFIGPYVEFVHPKGSEKWHSVYVFDDLTKICEIKKKYPNSEFLIRAFGNIHLCEQFKQMNEGDIKVVIDYHDKSPRELKNKIWEYRQQGATYSEIERQFGIARSTVHKIISEVQCEA